MEKQSPNDGVQKIPSEFQNAACGRGGVVCTNIAHVAGRNTSDAARGRDGVVCTNIAHVAGGNTSNAIEEIEKSGLAGLSEEQLQALVSMMNDQNRSKNENMTGKNIHDLWIIDTGANNHMTGNLKLLRDLRNVSACPVGMPDGKHVVATKEGTVALDGGLRIENVLYVPKLNCNLISISQKTDESNCDVQFTDKLCVIQDRASRKLIGAGERKDGLYFYHGVRDVKAFQINAENHLDLWHKRLRHPSLKVVQLIPSAVSGYNSEYQNKVCEICKPAKQTRDKFYLSSHKASESFELIHCDLWGPYRTPFSCGASYFLTLVDDYSRAVWIYLLHDKREVSRTMMNFFALVERQFDKQVKIVRSDNRTKFTCLKNYFFEHGVIHQTSCIRTLQQNGRVERKHRHILNVARALRFQGNLPIEFWGECVLTVGYLINRTPSVLNGKTPYEMLHKQPPSYEHLRVFGSLCYAYNQDRKDKFASRTRKCVFVGYSNGQKGWKLFDLESEKFCVSRDVEFVETEFPFASKQHSCGEDQRVQNMALIDECVDEDYDDGRCLDNQNHEVRGVLLMIDP